MWSCPLHEKRKLLIGGWSSWITMPRITTKLLGDDDEIVRRGRVQFFCMDLFTLCIPVLIHILPFFIKVLVNVSIRKLYHYLSQYSFPLYRKKRLDLSADAAGNRLACTASFHQAIRVEILFLMESWCTLTSCQLGLFLSVNSTRAECNLASSCFNFVKALSVKRIDIFVCTSRVSAPASLNLPLYDEGWCAPIHSMNENTHQSRIIGKGNVFFPFLLFADGMLIKLAHDLLIK